METYSDQDLHWITVHPNGKGEKPGVKVALNGQGNVVKGPKGLKDEINNDGGLPGAESIPLDELSKAKGKKFPTNGITKLVELYKPYDVTEEAYVKVVEDHPNLFFSDDDGNVAPHEEHIDEINNLAHSNMVGGGSGEQSEEEDFSALEDTFIDLLEDGDLSTPDEGSMSLFDDDVGEGEGLSKEQPKMPQDEPQSEGGVKGQPTQGNAPQGVIGGVGEENGGNKSLPSGEYPFPKDVAGLAGLTMVKPLGGASGANATLYKDANGNMFVMKRFAPTDKVGQQRLKEECDADAYYIAGGAQVPRFKLYGDAQSGYTKLSQYIPSAKTLGQVWGEADDALKAKIKDGLRKNFALDVMAGAWDVLGTGHDNILVDEEGNVWRCDNGGAFNRRAQGGEKDETAWGNGHIDDLWTMRGLAPGLDGKTISDPTGKKDFFGDISTHSLLSDIVTRDWDKMIAHLPDETREVMKKRIANAKEYYSVCDNVVTAGKYGDGKHAEDITLNYHCLNKFGAKTGCTNKDIKPGSWGFCRTKSSVWNPAPKLEDFLKDKEPKITDFTNIPEPDIASFMPTSDVKHAANVLKTAGISLNKHLFVDKDGKPNQSSIDSALALKPLLEEVIKEKGDGANKAKEMLDYVNLIEQAKKDGFKNIKKEFPHSPSGDLQLATEEAKIEAQKKYDVAHKEWEAKTANAEGDFQKALAEWKVKESAAKKQLAEALNKWHASNGNGAFKWADLTACFEDFCKQNGIESTHFWTNAKEQGYQCYKKGACRFKVMEILAMGGNLDHPTSSVSGIADYMSNVHLAASEYKSHPDWLERDTRAYVAMKALTQMLLHNSSFIGNFQDKKCIRMCRTESKDVINKYGIKLSEPTIFPCGAHESFGVFDTYCYKGSEAVLCDVPYSRISSIYFLKSPSGNNMYAGDGENEAGVNAVGLPRIYTQHVGTGEPISDMWDDYEAAMEQDVVSIGM